MEGTEQNPRTSPEWSAGIPEVDSEQLLAPRGELAIAHAGEVYRLRRTRKGGLILTK